jgi:hypothetical protein
MAVIVETLMAEDLELGKAATTKTHPGGGTLNGTQISLSTFSLAGTAGVANTKAWTTDPTTIASKGYASTTIEVPGAALGDKVLASYEGMVYDTVDNRRDLLMLSAQVTDTNTVTAVLFNPTDAQITPAAAATLSVLVFTHR